MVRLLLFLRYPATREAGLTPGQLEVSNAKVVKDIEVAQDAYFDFMVAIGNYFTDAN